MNQSTLIVFAIIFQLTLVFIIIGSALYYESNLFVAIKNIPSTAYVLTGIGILLTYLSIRSGSLKDSCTFGFNMVDRGEKDVLQKFVQYYDDVPNFIDSMDFKIFRKSKPNNNEKSNTPKQDVIEKYIATLIFQSVEDYIISSSLTNLSDKEWFIMFLGWFQSDILKEHWKIHSINFSEYTNRFINRLIKFSQENNDQFTSIETIDSISSKFVLSREYKELVLNIEDKHNISFGGW